MFVVLYLTGGWANRAERSTISFVTREEADNVCEEVRRMGYAARVVAL